MNLFRFLVCGCCAVLSGAAAFGWAAAVAQWVFVAPRRAGESVDVKVRMPFDFDAPAG